MQKVLPFCLLLLALHSDAQTISPSTLNEGGGSKKISADFFIDWSVGESTVIQTYDVPNPGSNIYVGPYFYVTSGVLQPFDNVHVIVNPNIPVWSVYEIQFSPVPASDYITINFKSTLSGTISIQLLGLSGVLLDEKKFDAANSAGTLKWDLSQRLSGFYFFRIILTSPEGKLLKEGTFKIEKIK